jgi:hypothetical protein
VSERQRAMIWMEQAPWRLTTRLRSWLGTEPSASSRQAKGKRLPHSGIPSRDRKGACPRHRWRPVILSSVIRNERWLFAALLALMATTVHAQPISDLFDTDRFHAAYLGAPASEVTFKPFQELNWEAYAHRILPWLNPDHPTPAQIARLSTFEAAGPQFRSVEFRAPLDAAVRRATYLLIAATGVVPLRPVQLKGSVDFQFDTSMTAVEHRSFSGYVVGQPLHAVTSAAFAVIGGPDDIHDVDPRARFERRKNAGPAVYDFADGRRMVTWTSSSVDCSDPKSSCLDAASAVSFRLRDERFLLVKWKDAICDSAYTLFLVGATLKPLAGNMYDCDV